MKGPHACWTCGRSWAKVRVKVRQEGLKWLFWFCNQGCMLEGLWRFFSERKAA